MIQLFQFLNFVLRGPLSRWCAFLFLIGVYFFIPLRKVHGKTKFVCQLFKALQKLLFLADFDFTGTSNIAPFLDMQLEVRNGKINSMIYNKTDDFPFKVVSMPIKTAMCTKI